MRCIVYHSNPIDVNVNIVSHGKNKRLMRYNKNHGTSSLKKHVFHEHAEKGKRRDFLFEKPLFWSPSFLAATGLTTKLTLHNMPFLKTWFYTLQKGTIWCPLSKIHGASKVHGFKTMFPCCVSISTSIGDRSVAKHYGKN